MTSGPAAALWREEQHALPGVQSQVSVVTLSCCLFKSNYVVICSYSRTQVKWSGFGFSLMGPSGGRRFSEQTSLGSRCIPAPAMACATEQEDPGATYVSFAHTFLGVLLESILNCRKH